MANTKGLPPGGVWRMVRGARVYIVDGNVVAGAEGHLSKQDHEEITAIHTARVNKKDTGMVLFEGTEVRVGKERKRGIVEKLTKTTVHIRYGDEVRKVPRKDVRRSDAFKLSLEAKLADGGTPEILSADFSYHAKPAYPDPRPVEKRKADKKVADAADQADVAADSRSDEDFEEDMQVRMTPAKGLRATFIKHDANGNPVMEPMLGTDNAPIIDMLTKQPRMRYVTEERDNATEDEILRNHQGLLISEIVNPAAKKHGLEYLQREWRDADGNATDLYGDLVQAGNIGYLYGIREFSHMLASGIAPKVSLQTHGLLRARQNVQRQAQDIFNTVKLPEKLLAPLAIVNAHEQRLTQELGRKPTEQELANGLGAEPIFRDLVLKTTPTFDMGKQKFNDGTHIKDPLEKLRAIYSAKAMQRAGSLDQTANQASAQAGDKEMTALELVEDEALATPEEALVAKQEVEKRQRDLKGGVKKLLNSVLEDREMDLIIHRFGIGNRKQDGLMDLPEVAEAMGISLPLAKKISASAMKKLSNAPEDMLEKLKKVYMTKSLFGFDMLMKALFVYDLEKSLDAFGIDVDDLDDQVTRVFTGEVDDLKKALGITEFCASIVEVPGSTQVRAYIAEYDLASLGAVILKSFHKQADPAKKAASVKKYVTEHPEKYHALAVSQAKSLQGGTSWSEKLLLDNPGSCWITWHGEHILVHGDSGKIIHQHTEGQDTAPTPLDAEDHGATALSEEMSGLREKWVTKDPSGKLTGGYLHEWRQKMVAEDVFGVANKEKKLHPSGWFMAVNPETGRRVAYKVEIIPGKGGKATTNVTMAFDPDADEKLNIGDWNAIYKYLGYEKGTGNAYERLMADANQNGKHKLRVLTEEEFDQVYKGTTTGAKEAVQKSQIVEVTPENAPAGRRVYEMDLGNGRISRFDIQDGHFADPVMQKLINPSIQIDNANDLMAALYNGVGNEVWVTVTPNKMDRLAHHVKLRYDGNGSPVVVGGAFEGYRFQDASEVEDQEDKDRSLFKNGQPIRSTRKLTEKQDTPLGENVEVKIRNPINRVQWVTATIKEKTDDGWRVELPQELVNRGVVFENESNTAVLQEDQLKATKEQLNVATEMPIIDTHRSGLLNLTVPEAMRDTFTGEGIDLDAEGRANISLKQFMDIRDKIGGFSLSMKANDLINAYYKQLEREALGDVEVLRGKFHPANLDGFREDSFLRKTGIYNSQAEGIEHLVRAQKGIAGHGMGTGKTLLGVVGSMYLRDQAIKEGRKPGKTLIISPASIQAVWLNEINHHTNVGAVIVTNSHDKDGMFGNVFEDADLRSRAISPNDYSPDHNEHFVVMSYQQFMANPARVKEWAKSFGFENIVIDEVHAFKTEGKRMNKALSEVSDAFPNVWGLSGTPMDNQVPDIYNLVHAITGGKHDLGTAKEFSDQYLFREGGKIVGMNESKLDELGRKLSRFVQFRNGYSDRITYVDPKSGELRQVNFPSVPGENRSYGQLSPVVGTETAFVERKTAAGKAVTGPDGKPLTRQVNTPAPKTKLERDVYSRYASLEKQSLSEAERQSLEDMAESGLESSSQNYLQGVMRLQQFLNAPYSEQAYYTIERNADGSTGRRSYNSDVDAQGHKRYYKAKLDKNGKPTEIERDAKGKPVLLPPMHHGNPKADHLRKIIMDHLAEHEAEMTRRRKINATLAAGQEPLPLYAPKVVITSGYTTFGAEVIENVLRDIQRDTGRRYGMYTGDIEQKLREKAKVEFAESPDFSFMVVSDAGKEGIGLGNGHMLVHYDQDFNPNLMAQKTARVLRSNSWKNAAKEQRENTVKIVSVTMPGTIEDSVIRAQQRKLDSIARVEAATRKAEGAQGKSDFAEVRAGAPKKWVQRVKEKSIPLVTTWLHNMQ